MTDYVAQAKALANAILPLLDRNEWELVGSTVKHRVLRISFGAMTGRVTVPAGTRTTSFKVSVDATPAEIATMLESSARA